MAGPINLIQGGYMMIGRLPIWIDPAKGHGWDTTTHPKLASEVGKVIEPNKKFWGFAACLFSYATLLEKSALSEKLKKWNLAFNLTGTKPSVVDGKTVSVSPMDIGLSISFRLGSTTSGRLMMMNYILRCEMMDPDDLRAVPVRTSREKIDEGFSFSESGST